MTCIRFTDFLLSFYLLLFLSQVYGQEPELVLKEEGNNFVLGYCFGADYIIVYKSVPEGQQLLGNSSTKRLPDSLPEDLRNRIDLNYDEHLLGLQISDLIELDSGIYRRECWQNQELVSNRTEQLLVCKMETSSEEMIVNEDGEAEVQCNSPFIGLEGTSILWYREEHPDFIPALILDTSISMKPLIEDLQDVVEVKDNGAMLVLDKRVLENFPQFYCVVIKGKKCLSFQNIYSQENSESRDKFVSRGDRVVLNCPADGNQQQWDTPLGQINRRNMTNNQMYLSAGDKPESFSLIIPVISDEHSGTYSCTSPSSEIQYSLFICPKSKFEESFTFKGQEVSLDCNVGLKTSDSVQWHRLVQDHYELIGEVDDGSIIISEDLKGKVNLSESGLLTISDLRESDVGVYRCIVLANPEQTITDNKDYDEESSAQDYPEYTVYEPFDLTVRCIFKQETSLNITEGRMIPAQPSTPPSESTNAPGASTAPWYAVVGGLVVFVIVVIGVLYIVILIKRRQGSKGEYRKTQQSSDVNLRIHS